METLENYFQLPQNNVLKLKYKGETIYGRLMGIGSYPMPDNHREVKNKPVGTFAKIKDFNGDHNDIEVINIDAKYIDGDIEILNV